MEFIETTKAYLPRVLLGTYVCIIEIIQGKNVNITQIPLSTANIITLGNLIHALIHNTAPNPFKKRRYACTALISHEVPHVYNFLERAAIQTFQEQVDCEGYEKLPGVNVLVPVLMVGKLRGC
ncbi:hypothetical protein Y032_0003g1454 [Ancylostoma ceylanicum]|uniref:Uncharacterized protein n=1 Tax=Ancylostoma ceylanicum TaxID=53326 RepID=A0A016VY05_9BILA|nr:hypothetical protein Y032_0003g1454 [Ancylostoma ceylanicum]